MIYTHIAVGAIAGAVAFTAGWQAQGWRWEAADGARAKTQLSDQVRRAEHVDGAAGGFERARAHNQERIRYVTREVDRIVALPEYRDGVCLGPDGLRAVAAALGSPEPAASEPAAAVPAASAAR